MSSAELSAIIWRGPSLWFSRFWLRGIGRTRSGPRSKTAMSSKCVLSLMWWMFQRIWFYTPNGPIPRETTCLVCTELRKRTGPRLRELAPADGGCLDTGSRNLGSIVLRSSEVISRLFYPMAKQSWIQSSSFHSIKTSLWANMSASRPFHRSLIWSLKWFQAYAFPSDLDSTAGSEWEGESNAGSQHLSAVSKEQLFNMLQKSRTRYSNWKRSLQGDSSHCK